MAEFQNFFGVTLANKVSSWNPPEIDYIEPHGVLGGFVVDDAALSQVSFDDAGDRIRRRMKSYLTTVRMEWDSEWEALVQRVTPMLPSTPQKVWWIPSTSTYLEEAISSSKAILSIESDAEEGVAAYTEETWQRAIRLLRILADLYWQAAGDYLPTPSIGPAVDGSIDLFWEKDHLTLLINVPAEPDKGGTFFGRRLQTSKISGVLDKDDLEPKHLAAWLTGHE